MTTADQYRLNATNCAQMAETAENGSSGWKLPGALWLKSKIG
jgi:hypothetical protein